MVKENQTLIALRDGVGFDPYLASISSDFSNTQLSYVQGLANKLQLLNVTLIPGVFERSVAKFSVDNPGLEVAAGIIDSDLYLGYTSPLAFFQKHLIVGGFVYLDEYFSLKFPGARIACDEFLERNQDFVLESWNDPNDSSWKRFGLRRISITNGSGS